MWAVRQNWTRNRPQQKFRRGSQGQPIQSPLAVRPEHKQVDVLLIDKTEKDVTNQAYAQHDMVLQVLIGKAAGDQLQYRVGIPYLSFEFRAGKVLIRPLYARQNKLGGKALS